MEILRVEHLSKQYGNGETAVKALDDITFSVEKGEFVAIIGPSGSGKSTLLHMLGGVDRPSEGKVFVDNADIYQLNETQLAIFRRRQIGLVYQFFNLIPVLTVEENITLPLLLDGQQIDQKLLNNIVKTLDLDNRLSHLPNQLSGGQQQRVSIGRALINIDMLDTTTWIEEDKIADYLKGENEEILENGKYPYQVNLCVLEGEALKKYIEEIGMDYNNFMNTKQLSAIVIDTINFKDEEKDKYVETKAVHTMLGDNLNLSFQEENKTTPTELEQPLVVAGMTDARPMGVMSLGSGANLNVIISRDTYNKLIEGSKEAVSKEINSFVYMVSDNPLQLQENIEEVQSTYSVSKLSIFNVYTYRRSEQQMLLLLSVFTNAFIILITAICIANIINTISTSIAMRKREFAMLKSVGITPKGFNKMLNYESIFYGVKALIYGLPISFAVMYLIYGVLTSNFNYQFNVPIIDIIIVVVSVFLIVGLAMLYSSSKVKKDNIIDALKQDIT